MSEIIKLAEKGKKILEEILDGKISGKLEDIFDDIIIQAEHIHEDCPDCDDCEERMPDEPVHNEGYY